MMACFKLPADAIHVIIRGIQKEFKTQLPQIEVIRIAWMQLASQSQDRGQEGGNSHGAIVRETESIDEDLRKSVQRNASQIRPGNLIYFRVEDYDRDQGGRWTRSRSTSLRPTGTRSPS